MTRFIGIDYGSKRVGLAISDGLGLTAQPLEVVARTKAVDRILDLVAEYEVATVVMGLPTGLSGGEGISAQEARALLAKAVADKVSRESDDLIKQAKDMASAAVLLIFIATALLWGYALLTLI